MHGPLSFGCNFSCKVRQDLAAGVADDEVGRRCFRMREIRAIAICGRFITVQLAGGPIARPAKLHFCAPEKGRRDVKQVSI
jgi:hypothetical protein